VRQHLIDIVHVIACALALLLITTWVQSSQEAPMVKQLLHNLGQRGHVSIEADHLLPDKARMQHASGPSD
jgi:hypothetical protein